MKTFILILFLCFALDALIMAQAGTIDAAFNGDGKLIYEPYEDKHAESNQLLSLPDGKILVTGYSAVPGMLQQALVMRLLPDGTFDNTFNGNGKLFISNPNGHCYSACSVLTPEGKIMVLVKIENTEMDSLAIHRFLYNGLPDNSFSGDGVEYFHFGFEDLGSNSMILQPDGKILVAGYTGNNTDDYEYMFAARRLPNGDPDVSFDGDGVNLFRMGESWGNIFDIMLHTDGKIYIGGFGYANGFEDFAAARFLPNGHLDETFSGDGIVLTSFFENEDDGAYGAVLQPDGKLVLAGYAGYSSENGEVALVRYDQNGELDNSFSGDGKLMLQVSGKADQARTVLLQPDGKIFIGGATNGFNQHPDMLLARITPDGILDHTFNDDGIVVYNPGPSTDYITCSTWEPGGKILVGGTSWENHHRVIVARFFAGELVKTKEAPVTLNDIQLYPNPVTDFLKINYSLSDNQSFAVNLYNMEGKLISQLSSYADRSIGNHEEEFQLNDITPGMYYLQFESALWTKSMKVIVE